MKRLAAILLFLTLWPLPGLAADFAAKVAGVSDGDGWSSSTGAPSE
jgi:hypothetical protein